MSEPKPSWGFHPGDVIDGYSIEECFGGGSTYEVYGSTNVVVKYLRPHLIGHHGALRRARREAELLGRLEHRSVVRLIDAVFDGPRPHLVLERVPGSSLRTRLRVRVLSVDETIALGTTLASQLTHLARHDVVHLDVKPSNVILGPRPVLVDFSVARDVTAAVRLANPVGTDIWMAPEQCLLGEGGRLDAAADVWGVGATLWRALLGKPPFKRLKGYDRDDPLQRFPQLASQPRPLPAHVPPALRSLLATCLSVEASFRPTAAELTETLRVLQPAAA